MRVLQKIMSKAIVVEENGELVQYRAHQDTRQFLENLSKHYKGPDLWASHPELQETQRSED